MREGGADEGGWDGRGGNRVGHARERDRTWRLLKQIEGGIEADEGVSGKIEGVWTNRGCCGGWGRGG